ncbi:hypothetical protein A3752_06745 [Oleiphilus sp. HI0081]|nr:hypothetical protein A3749_10985 [Oleiphilus sp. HI0078]KZZ22347.1 hypothetical protein A3752_06745 [Oleiphilus sp. HI0081]
MLNSNVHQIPVVNPRRPRPLVKESFNAPKFPLDALGDVLSGAAKTIATQVQCPESIAGQSILSAAALATQGFKNIIIDGREYPISIFCLTVAESGDRKSAADWFALKAHKAYEKKAVENYKGERDKHKNAILSCEAERNKLQKDKSLDSEERLERLNNIEQPPELLNPQILLQEPTLEGIFKSFQFGQASQGLFNDEGGQFLGGHAMSNDNRQKTITGISKYWDGSEIVRTRSGECESVTLYNKRLSIHLMIQPVIANELFSDKLLQEQGFLPRFLISYSPSIAGSRFYKEINTAEDPYLLRYWSKMESILNTPLPISEEDAEVPTLSLSASAKKYWIDVYNRIEAKLGKGGHFSDVKPTASKAAENILRIAGILCLVDDLDSSEIQLNHVKNATMLVHYYLNEVKRLTEESESELLLERAQALLDWLQDKRFPEGITRRQISKSGPRPCKVRGNAKNTQKLLDILVKYGWLETLPEGTVVNGAVPKIAYQLVEQH